MKPTLFGTFIFLCHFFTNIQAQNLQGYYQDTGYFFHPSNSRAIIQQKYISNVGTNTYQVALGDLGSYQFQFDVDATNHLVNWVALGSTPAAPSSGFMTADNPGAYSYYPGTTSGFVQSIYNNTYNPATKTFYMHFGYGIGSTDQTGYTRQLYEKFVLVPRPNVLSYSPASGTYGTLVTIKGKNLDGVNYVRFGYNYASCDTFYVVNDSTIKAIVGANATGKLYVDGTYGSDSSTSVFTYTPPVVVNGDWEYLGTAGFSTGRVYDVNMALTTTKVPYVVYQDSATLKIMVKKYSGGAWISVGTAVADSGTYGNIAISSTNVPYVAYFDNAYSRHMTVKKLSGSNWVTVGTPGFGYPSSYGIYASIRLDKNNNPYVVTDSSNYIIVYRFDGTQWQNLGGYVDESYDYALTIDTVTNTPYVAYQWSGSSQANVLTYNSGSGYWEVVGNYDFTSGVNGAYHISTATDRTGKPMVALQDDDGFERLSVYKLSPDSMWVPAGAPRFSKNHCHWTSLRFTKNNLPVVAFESSSFNGEGSVMTMDAAGHWNFVGTRGFAPLYQVDKDALAIDTSNVAYLAFADESKGFKASVMKYDTSIVTNILNACPAGTIAIASDISGSSYQWLVNTGSGYVNVLNNSYYSGGTTQTLLLAGVPTSWYGYKYRCLVNGKFSSVNTLHFVDEWTGSIDAAWEKPGNWSCGVLPDGNTDVILDAGDKVVLNSVASVRSIKVSPSASFTVATGTQKELKVLR